MCTCYVRRTAATENTAVSNKSRMRGWKWKFDLSKSGEIVFPISTLRAGEKKKRQRKNNKETERNLLSVKRSVVGQQAARHYGPRVHALGCPRVTRDKERKGEGEGKKRKSNVRICQRSQMTSTNAFQEYYFNMRTPSPCEL